PGTHDSGSYSAGNTGYVRNQTHDIGKQLEYGIRSFDIRVKKRPNGKYVMFHGTYPPGPKQQLFQDALDQIKDFASKHPHEILIIYIDGFRHDSNEEQITFQDLYINYLKDYLVVLDVDNTSRHIEGSSYTPAKMYDMKKN